MSLEAHKFREAWDKEAMHVVLGSNHKLTESPECILIRVEIHQEEGGYLWHALAVANLTVIHAVGSQHVEQVLLPAVVPLSEHYMVSVGAVYIQIYLSDVRAV